eukprot:12694500-Ditylum_brightwellii.AAC.1
MSETEVNKEPLLQSSVQALTIERITEKDELILAQTTSQFCRCCCFQPSINWVLSEQDNFEAG